MTTAWVGRRALLAGAVAACVTPGRSAAQPPEKVYRVGYLGNSSPALEKDLVAAFRDGLRALGYREGQDLRIEYRWAEGDFDRLPALAAELVRVPVDVIVVAATPGTLAAMRATRTTPIVMAASADAVGNRLVASLARPGGNVTGSSTRTHELDVKRLELLKEMIPRISRVAFLWNRANPANVRAAEPTRRAVRALHVTLAPEVSVRSAGDLDEALATIARGRPDALLVAADRFLLTRCDRIVAFAMEHRLAATYAYPDCVVAGGLMSYAPSFTELFRRAAVFTDKILKGASPRELPIEQPEKFELTINLRTARALALTIPQSIRLRADRVIE